MAEAVIVSAVVERLQILLTEEAQVLNGMSDQVEQVLVELRKIQWFLKNAELRHNKRESVRAWLADVRELAYDAEDMLERFVHKVSFKKSGGGIKSILRRYVCKLSQRAALKQFGSQIEGTKAKISKLITRLQSFGLISLSEAGESSSSAHDRPNLERFYIHNVVEPLVFVGLEKDIQVLLQHLVNDNHHEEKCYRVVSICGMGGLGKTTLAQKIYNHTTTKRHFTCLAWVSISQKWQTKLVLQKILVQLLADPQKEEEIHKLEVDELQKKISEVQKKKRCLIVR